MILYSLFRSAFQKLFNLLPYDIVIISRFECISCLLGFRSVTDPRDGKRVALKKMPSVFQNMVSCKRVYRELRMLCQFKHDNVSLGPLAGQFVHGFVTFVSVLLWDSWLMGLPSPLLKKILVVFALWEHWIL